MKQEAEFEDECEMDDVPVSPLRSEERKNRYGSVRGLPDEELAEPAELKRQVVLQEWGPVLALSARGRRGWIRPSFDENWGVDFGAFATVDFSRGVPEFDKVRYKANILREKLRDLVFTIEMVSERLPSARGSRRDDPRLSRR